MSITPEAKLRMFKCTGVTGSQETVDTVDLSAYDIEPGDYIVQLINDTDQELIDPTDSTGDSNYKLGFTGTTDKPTLYIYTDTAGDTLTGLYIDRDGDIDVE